jgi:hypothetical protein
MSGWNQRPLTPVEPAQMIPLARPKPRRNREFEKGHPAYVIRVRDISLRDKILALAQSISVPADDVARAFLSAGLDAADKQAIDLTGIRSTRGRMTLYPTGAETWKVHDEPVTWTTQLPAVRRKRPRTESEKSTTQKERNQKRMAYRLPPEVVERFERCYLGAMGIQSEKELARHEGRKGELFLLLLDYGLQMYLASRLPLEPEIVSVHARLP